MLFFSLSLNYCLEFVSARTKNVDWLVGWLLFKFVCRWACDFGEYFIEFPMNHTPMTIIKNKNSQKSSDKNKCIDKWNAKLEYECVYNSRVDWWCVFAVIVVAVIPKCLCSKGRVHSDSLDDVVLFFLSVSFESLTKFEFYSVDMYECCVKFMEMMARTKCCFLICWLQLPVRDFLHNKFTENFRVHFYRTRKKPNNDDEWANIRDGLDTKPLA